MKKVFFILTLGFLLSQNSFSEPNKSLEAHQQLTADAESILQKLNLPYRSVDICTGDLGFSSSRTFDLEVWLPSSKSDYFIY